MLPLSKLGRAGLAALARHAAESTSGAQAELPWRHAAARAYSAALPQLAEGALQRVCKEYLRRPGRSTSLVIVARACGFFVHIVLVQAKLASLVLVASRGSCLPRQELCRARAVPPCAPPWRAEEPLASTSGADANAIEAKGIRLSGAPLYLDMQATTPLDPRVLDAMLPYMTELYGNPHSRTHLYGWETEDAVEVARKQARTRGRRGGGCHGRCLLHVVGWRGSPCVVDRLECMAVGSPESRDGVRAVHACVARPGCR
jgi:hypothetical protein